MLENLKNDNFSRDAPNIDEMVLETFKPSDSYKQENNLAQTDPNIGLKLNKEIFP